MSAVTVGQPSGHERRQLRTELATFVAARRRVGALDGAIRGAVAGCVLAGVAGLASRFLGFDGGSALSALLLIGTTGVAAALEWLRPIDEDRVALEIDRRLDLAERVTTAVELDRLIGNRGGVRPLSPKRPRGSRAKGGTESDLARPSLVWSGRLDLAEDQIADAVANLAAARPSAVYPVRQSRRRALALILGLALAIAPWVVAWPAVIGSRLPISRSAAAQQLEADRLESIAKRLDAEGSSSNRQLNAQIAAQLRQAAAALRASSGNGQQASRDLLQAESAATSLTPPTGEPASLTLSRIADALNGEPTTQPITRALDQQDPGKAGSALSQVASSLPSMSPDRRLSVAQALQAASDAARNSDTRSADQLQQAAEAARNGDPTGLQSAVQALDQLQQTSQDQRDIAQARSEIESSRQAIAQADQSNPSNTGAAGSVSPSPLGGSQSSSSSASNADGSQKSQSGSDQSAGGAQASGQSTSSPSIDGANQIGGGSGTGSTSHLGATHDLQGLAQRQVVVPATGDGQPGSISLSSKLQTGTAGSAQVDYANVLPEYRQQAQNVVDGNVVPIGLKQVVKGYFDALAPK